MHVVVIWRGSLLFSKNNSEPVERPRFAVTHTHKHTHLLTLSLFITSSSFRCSLFIPSFCVCAHSDLRCNNVVNWGYCARRSQPDRQTSVSCSHSISSPEKTFDFSILFFQWPTYRTCFKLMPTVKCTFYPPTHPQMLRFFSVSF